MAAALFLTIYHAFFRSLLRYPRRRKPKQHFKSATTGVATKNMRNEIMRLVNTVSDPVTRKVRKLRWLPFPCCPDCDLQAFDTEMQSFFYLFTRYLAEKAESKELCVHCVINLALASVQLTQSRSLVCGIASSLLLPTKSSRTMTSPLPPTPRPSTSSPSSRSMVGSARPWVRRSGSTTVISCSHRSASRYDRREECT